MSSRSAVEKRLATLRPKVQLIEETCYAKTTTPPSFRNLSDSRDGWFARYSTISTIVLSAKDILTGDFVRLARDSPRCLYWN